MKISLSKNDGKIGVIKYGKWTLYASTLFQETLDKVAMHEALTGWMEANAGDVIYNGGAER